MGPFDTPDVKDTHGMGIASHAEIKGTPWGGEIVMGAGDPEGTGVEMDRRDCYEGHYPS